MDSRALVVYALQEPSYNTTPFRFNDLFPELRRMVFELILSGMPHSIFDVNSQNFCGRPAEVISYLRVCKLWQNEILEIFMSPNTCGVESVLDDWGVLKDPSIYDLPERINERTAYIKHFAGAVGGITLLKRLAQLFPNLHTVDLYAEESDIVEMSSYQSFQNLITNENPGVHFESDGSTVSSLRHQLADDKKPDSLTTVRIHVTMCVDIRRYLIKQSMYHEAHTRPSAYCIDRYNLLTVTIDPFADEATNVLGVTVDMVDDTPNNHQEGALPGIRQVPISEVELINKHGTFPAIRHRPTGKLRALVGGARDVERGVYNRYNFNIYSEASAEMGRFWPTYPWEETGRNAASLRVTVPESLWNELI